MRLGRAARARGVVSQRCRLVIVAGLVTLLAMGRAGAAEPPGVALNEVNCTGSDWVEVINRSNVEVSLANWLLTDDPLDQIPPRDAHRMRFGAGTVLAPGEYVVVPQGDGGFPFDLSCGDDTLRLANADDALVDAVTLPAPAASGTTYGRIPDGTGEWTVTLPTYGLANAIATDGTSNDAAWLYDPLLVNEIDLTATQAALSQLNEEPDEYVEARITLRSGASAYGPYRVGLKLKGHSAFRTLAAKAAFKVKFGFAVAGQRFHGLKGLTLNNMVQDPSMIAEATSSLLFAASGVPTARVGYAYVRLNDADYGLYADVETVDSVMARRLFTNTKHIYKADATHDVIPGRTGELDVEEGSSTDRSDLEALAAARAGGADGWWERMQPVADLAAMTRAWAGEHYAGHWDGYSIAATNNYYLHSDFAGRFSLIPSGTDQTWRERTAFGLYGDGVLMRDCVADVDCRALYVDALRQTAVSPAVAALPAQAREIRAAIAPWRVRDPRREQTVAAGEADADAKLATLDSRTADLVAWLAKPSFVAAVPWTPPGDGGGGGGGGVGEASDLSVTGTVTPASAPVGDSHVWRLQVKNTGVGSPFGVVLDVEFSPNVAYGFSQLTRGTGCVPAGAALHCVLDFLGAAGDDSSTADVVIGTNVTGTGEVWMTAKASFEQADPTPSDDTLVLKANSPAVAAPGRPPVVRPLLGKPFGLPAKPVAGRQFTFSLPVTRSDTGAPLRKGTLACKPAVAGRVIRHAESFRAGRVRLSFVVPKTAKGKLLKIEIKVTASGQAAGRTYRYAVR